MLHFFQTTPGEILIGVVLFMLANLGVAWLLTRGLAGDRRSDDTEADGR